MFNKYLVNVLNIEYSLTTRCSGVVWKKKRTSVLYASSIFQSGKDSTSILKESKI